MYNRTGKTVYFNGYALQRGSGVNGNYFSGANEYWVTGIKKNAQDRYPWGKGKIQVDKEAVAEYKALTKQELLPESKYEVVELNNTIPTQHHAKQNEKL